MQLWSDSIHSLGHRARRWFIAGLVLLPLLMSVSGINADYVADAWLFASPQTWDSVKGHLTTERTAMGIYRPLGDLTIMAEYRLFGTNPVVPRAVRFTTYAATCLLAFLILEALSQSFLIGAIGGLIFTVMPSHVPSAFQIGQTVTLAAVFFSLLTFWLAGPAYHRKPSRLKVVLACFAYVAGLLSYEFSVFTPLFLIVFELFWGWKDGWAAVKERIVKSHLWLWAITMVFGCLKTYQLSKLAGQTSWGYGDLSSLTAVAVIKRFIPLFYGTTCPLQLSPALGVAALLLLCLSLKADWRLGLFLLIWVIVAPGLSYPQELVWCHRVYLASFGTAGLLGYLTVSCLGAALDTKRHSSRASVLISFLDWVVMISTSYWVFELFRASWVEFFSGEALINHPRFWAASITAIALVLRCAVSKSLLPKISRVPLKALSAGLIVLIVGWYASGFLRLMAMSVTESDDAAKLPEAIATVRGEVPDNTLILVIFDNSVAIKDREDLCTSLRCRLRSEYGKDRETLGATSFNAWLNSFQYNAIAPEGTLLLFRYDGKKAFPDPQLARRILKRQQSYLALQSDVTHARAVASTGASAELRLNPEVDSMLIDKAQLYTTMPMQSLQVRLEFTSNGGPASLELPAHIEGTKATVFLDREPLWMLAGHVSQVRISVVFLYRPANLLISEARLVQTKGRISETPLRLLPDGPSPTIVRYPRLPLTQVPIFFLVKDIARCVALP